MIFCTDQAGLPVTLFAAHSVAKCNKDRRFDILICSLTPLDLPTFITDLGIRNHVLSVQATIDAQSLKRVLPSTAYLRLWLPEYFANQYSRILYLDYDTVTQ
ncbi:MAG: glycosyltransferase family 8 protein, partial [Shimia sp.]|nr:glycosyltransferase family 8 protein [Shimia sp.]